MISKRILLKETLFYTISKIIPGVSGLVSVILFIRIAGMEEYGKYSFLLSQCYLISALGFGWLNQAQLRFHNIDSKKLNYKSSQIIAFCYSGAFSFIVISILSFFQSFSVISWIISLFSIISMGGYNYLKTLQQSKILPKKVILLTSLQSSLCLLIPLSLLFLYGKTSIIILFGMGLSSLIVNILFLLKKMINNKNYYYYSSFPSLKNNLIKKWIRYGSPLSIWFALGLALPFLDRFFIDRFLSAESLGIYSGVQEILTKVFSLIMFPLILAIHPRIMNYWNDSKKIEAIQIIKWGLAIMFISALTLLYSIWYLDSFFYFIINKVIPEFRTEHEILIIPLLLAGFLWQVSFLTHKMIELKEQTYLMVIFITISLAVNIVGNIYFIPRYGIIATANISFISAFIYCLLTGAYSVYLIYIKKIY